MSIIVSYPDSTLLAHAKQLGARKVHVLATSIDRERADTLKAQLEARGVSVRVWPVTLVWDDTLRIVSELYATERDVVIYATTMPLVSAAHVLGAKAVTLDGVSTRPVPTLPYAYKGLIGEKKLKILLALYERKYSSLDELAKKLKLSMPLLSYHVHGTDAHEGLVAMQLVSLGRRGATQAITLTATGELFVKAWTA